MSIGEVNRRKRITYNAKRDVQTHIMANNKESGTKRKKAFNLFDNGLTNLEVIAILDIAYTEVEMLRIAYERGCKK